MVSATKKRLPEPKRPAKRGRRTPALLKSLPKIPGYNPVSTAAEGDWFDEALALKAIEFFETCLVHSKGRWAGKPFILEPWQKAIVANLVGWKRADGTRRYRQAYIEVPRKNGKTLLLAGLGLFFLFCDGEKGAEIYCCASDRPQAALVGDAARFMAKAEPEMQSRCEVFRNTIAVPTTNSKLEILSAEADTKHGRSCSTLIYDELHTAPNHELWDTMVTSMGARQQPLAIAITTAGTSRQTICWEQHEYAEKVRDGLIEDSGFLPVIYAAPESMSFDDPRAWRIANPNLGVSVTEEFLATEARKAKELPQYEITFRTLYLNQWVTVQRRWIPADTWKACGDSFTLEDMAGEDCWVGIDLSTTTDLTAVALLFARDGEYKVWPLIFAPEERAEIRERQDRVPYVTWARQGFMTLTPGNVVDYEHIRHRLVDLASKFNFQIVGYDPWNAQMFATSLANDGMTMAEVRQGYRSLSEPTKRFESLVLSKKLKHPRNPVMDWAVSNVSVDMDPAGNVKPSKARSSERIDPVAATVTALAVEMGGVSDGPSVYGERGLLTIG